mgnify:CR=1 FL=1
MSPLFASGKGIFTPAPEGVHLAVCCEVVDMGSVESKFGPRDMIKIVWQIEELDDHGKRFEVHARYSRSIHPRSNLGKRLVSWRGRAFTETELEKFDLESIVGACCQLQIVHNITEGGSWANVENVLPLMKGMAKLSPQEYVALGLREGKGVAPGPKETTVDVGQDDDIPF